VDRTSALVSDTRRRLTSSTFRSGVVRFATEPPRLRVAVLAVGLLVSGYVAVQLANRVGVDRSQGEDIGRAGPPPGADDPSNRGIFIEGGTSERRSTRNEEDVPGGSPWSRADEDRRPLVVAGFWMQEHEVDTTPTIHSQVGRSGIPS